MAGTTIINRLKSIFFSKTSRSGKKNKRSHTGLWFGLFSSFIAAILFFSGVLANFDDTLVALIFQYGYNPSSSLSDILIVKKDQATSELMGNNPGRNEFASLFSFLGSSAIVESPSKGKAEKFKFLSIGLGFYENQDRWLIKDSFSKWLPAYSEVRTYLKSNSSERLTGLMKIDGRLWPEKGGNFIKVLALGRKPLILNTLEQNWSEEIDMDDPEGLGEAREEILSRWLVLLKNLIVSQISYSVSLWPYPDTAIEFNFFLNKPDDNSEYEVAPASVISFDFVLQGEKELEVDKKLESAIEKSKSKIILAGHTLIEEEFIKDTTEKDIYKTGGVVLSELEKVKLVSRKIMPHKKFLKPNVRAAMIDVLAGNKSYVTQVPLFVLNDEEKSLEPTFSLLTSMTALDARYNLIGSDSYVAEMDRVLKQIYPKFVKSEFSGPLVIKDKSIPVSSKGMMLIRYMGSTTKGRFKQVAFPSVSFYECFEKDLLLKLFKANPEKKRLNPDKAHKRTMSYGNNKGGKLCLVGPFEASDFDFYPTPLSYRSPLMVQSKPLMGVEIHANAIANILENKALRHPHSLKTLVSLILSSLLLGFLLDIFSPLVGFFITMAFVGGTFGYSYLSYYQFNQVFLFGAFLVSFPATWCFITLVNYLRQRTRARETKQMFSRFVAKDVVQYMLDNPDLVKPGGEKVELTIFFSDVAGFTSISEALTPEELVVLLNEYLGAMTDILFKYGGTLDKFIGDAVMAFWNHPRKQEDHALRACLCAIEMQDKINELQIGWAKRGLPRVTARAGLNTANVVVGYMGSQQAQMNFTCMGDGVNLASRLEGANKEYGTDLMISDATYQQVKHGITARFLDFLAVKGKKEPVKVHELISEKGKEPEGWFERVELYDKGIQLHLDRKWDEAIASFEAVLKKWPEDGPSKTYIARCNEYKIHPPPDGWDGRYILTHK